MGLLVEKVDVWVASIPDEPGGLANRLSVLADAGADLEFVIARRAPDKPGTGVVFVTPLRGDVEVEAGSEVGFAASQSLHSLRIEGDNKPGILAELTQKLAAAKINLRGLSAAVIGTRFIVFLAMDSAEDAAKAAKILQE